MCIDEERSIRYFGGHGWNIIKESVCVYLVNYIGGCEWMGTTFYSGLLVLSFILYFFFITHCPIHSTSSTGRS